VAWLARSPDLKFCHWIFLLGVLLNKKSIKGQLMTLIIYEEELLKHVKQ